MGLCCSVEDCPRCKSVRDERERRDGYRDGCCKHPNKNGCEPATDSVEPKILAPNAGDAAIDAGVPIREPTLASNGEADDTVDFNSDII
ncbi:hypothetical protein BOX15_Mlig009568g1 [Macrostomum lignano]|uniref:Uncharacterized protein n=1 Tax=Macrostomum lignano TaxID=282301 RepID=A0A267G4Y5_9PLAT|nr:hypothetical protein BOX15_Mlig009568g1 [Macrostomum lignano]